MKIDRTWGVRRKRGGRLVAHRDDDSGVYNPSGMTLTPRQNSLPLRQHRPQAWASIATKPHSSPHVQALGVAATREVVPKRKRSDDRDRLAAFRGRRHRFAPVARSPPGAASLQPSTFPQWILARHRRPPCLALSSRLQCSRPTSGSSQRNANG